MTQENQVAYKVIMASTLSQFEPAVNAAINDGYFPIGGAQYALGDWSQAMVLRSSLTVKHKDVE